MTPHPAANSMFHPNAEWFKSHPVTAAGLADLHLEDKLGNYMHGKEIAPPYSMQDVNGGARTNSLPNSR